MDQARELAALSRSINRQIGVCIDRRGRILMVIVGAARGIIIPELPRARESIGRLRGFRLLHTHLGSDLLSQEDCMDMLFLRLDGIAALSVSEWGEPVMFQHAHLMPPNPSKQSYLLHPPIPWDKVTIDFFAEVQALEEELARAVQAAPLGPVPILDNGLGTPLQKIQQKSLKAHPKADQTKRAILVHVSSWDARRQDSSLTELADLACTAGVVVAGILKQRGAVLNTRYILGLGKLAELEVLALQANAGLIIFDGELAPSQLRNITSVSKRTVLDRTQLILDIFAQRARSKAGKLQVELAQLHYLLPRLVGQNKAFDRLMGGIGGRGPGETKLETDRRRIRTRLARIKEELGALRQRRAFARARRAKKSIPVASLVGYTNAGKSTLLNQLTGADVLAEDRLFATLDPTTRQLRFPSEQKLILTDTVGFIRSLPQELAAAFQATLEELEDADLLVHVADAAHPECEMQIQAVEDILADLKLMAKPKLLLFNKADMISDEQRLCLSTAYPAALFMCALTGEGLKEVSLRLIHLTGGLSQNLFACFRASDLLGE